MVTFRDLVKGEVAPQENPFFHHNIREPGDSNYNWKNSGRRLKLDEVAYDYDANGPTLELVVKAGWYAKIQIKTENSEYFTGFSVMSDWGFDTDAERPITTFETGLKSVLQVSLYGGAALAVSSEELSLSPYMKRFLGYSSNPDLGVVILVTPPADAEGVDPEDAIRRLTFNEMDDGCSVTLIEWGRDVTHGSAVTEATTSRDSMGIEEFLAQFPDYEETSQDSIFSQWTYDRIVEAHTDSMGNLYDISVAFINPNGPFHVMVNGFTAEEYTTAFAAESEANRLDAEWSPDGVLPLYYRREVSPPDVPDEPFEWFGLGEWFSDLPSGWVLAGGAVAIVGGVLVGYFLLRGIGTGLAKKAVGSGD